MKDTVIQRIKELKKIENLTNETLSEKTGLSVETIKSMFSKKTNPSLETLIKINNAFPLYSTDWLISGKGSMLKSDEINTEIKQINGFMKNKILEFENELKETAHTIGIHVIEEVERNKNPQQSETVMFNIAYNHCYGLLDRIFSSIILETNEINIDYKKKYFSLLEENNQLLRKYNQFLKEEREDKKTIDKDVVGATSVAVV